MAAAGILRMLRLFRLLQVLRVLPDPERVL